MNTCHVKDCEELPTEKLFVTSATPIGDRIQEITLCDKHYQELTTGCTALSMGCKIKESE